MPLSLGIGLALSAAPTAGGAVPAAAALTASDTGSTPSTVRVTVPAGMATAAVWTGAPAADTEYTFDLYYARNGGAAVRVRCRRDDLLALPAAPGDTFAFATADGRSLYTTCAPYPTALTAPSGTTGTANCDTCGPPDANWTPSGAHVTLGGYGQFVQLSATDATARVVFVRGSLDGTTWTPSRAYWLPASGTLTVYCPYKLVALGNYAGVTVSVTAGAGATVGGTSGTQRLQNQFALTGTQRSVTTVAEFKTAVAAAVSGDEIVLAAGTYTLDVAITQASFTANNGVGGRVGAEGIRIRGATGTRGDAIVTGNGVSTNGNWSLTQTGATGRTWFEDMTFSFAAIAAGMDLIAGKYSCRNVNWTGASSNADDSISFAGNASGAIDAEFVLCNAASSGQDCWNGDGNAATNAACNVRLVNCTGDTAGANSNDQVLTSHNGLPVSIYGATYTNAVANVVSPDAATTPVHCLYCTFGPGAREAGLKWCNLFMCVAEVKASNTVFPGQANGYVAGNRITATGFISSTSLFRSASGTAIPATTTIEGNWLYSASATGRAYFASVGASAPFRRNVVVGFNTDAVRVANYSAGSTTAIAIGANTLVTCGATVNDASVPVTLRGNAFTSPSGTQLTAGGATTTGNYQTYRSQSGYTAGANDTAGSNAAVDATTYVPTASGNVDAGTGDGTTFPEAGGLDYRSFAWVYAAGSPPRGAVGRPVRDTAYSLLPAGW